MLSKMAQFVIYAHDILGWGVDDDIISKKVNEDWDIRWKAPEHAKHKISSSRDGVTPYLLSSQP